MSVSSTRSSFALKSCAWNRIWRKPRKVLCLQGATLILSIYYYRWRPHFFQNWYNDILLGAIHLSQRDTDFFLFHSLFVLLYRCCWITFWAHLHLTKGSSSTRAVRAEPRCPVIKPAGRRTGHNWKSCQILKSRRTQSAQSQHMTWKFGRGAQ